MSEAEIAERAGIMECVDDQSCGSCGQVIPSGAASNPDWFVDTFPQEDGTVLAEIRCPKCW